MTQPIDPTDTLASIVTTHPDLARVLEAQGLDYCCGGNTSLKDACEPLGLDADAVVAVLNEADSGTGPQDWTRLDAASLVDHVEATHHAYLHAEMPRLAQLAAKVRSVHGANHPELAEVESTFAALQADFDPHLAKEERVLFPMIRDLARGQAPPFPGGTMANPIAAMRQEHDTAGDLLALLRAHTDGYTTPPDACASYTALYAGLAELEADTHLHVHKENNRLFGLVDELEAALPSAEAAVTR